MLYFREGWNYLLELYFWIIAGAILLVSVTILLARPSPGNANNYNYDKLEGQIGETTREFPVGSSSRESNSLNADNLNNEELQEKLTQEIIEKIERRKWALGFVMFGSAFTMFGAISLFVSELEFITFLGSCMIYVGIIALIKGASFELQKDNLLLYNSKSVFFLLIFFINFIMLTELLGVLGSYAWSVAPITRKIGDLLLIYLLPYIVWKIVPTFGSSSNNQSVFRLRTTSIIIYTIFNYVLFLATSLEIIFWPIMKQYSEAAILVSLILILFSTLLGYFISTLKLRRHNE